MNKNPIKLGERELLPSEQPLMRNLIVRQYCKGRKAEDIIDFFDLTPSFVYETIEKYKKAAKKNEDGEYY